MSSSWPRLLVLSALGLAIGGAVSIACAVEYPTVAFRCNPRQTDNCPEEFKCCSDDPAAAGGALPQFMGRDDINGDTPFFADNNNILGTHGMCVHTADIPAGFALLSPNAAGCPIPCNPTWTDADIAAVCGGATFKCCQTVELDPKDCVDYDGAWRPAVGRDILDNGNSWSPNSLATHQDPNGTGCAQITGSSDIGDPGYSDCLSQLSVADQRGFCMSVAGCPLAVGVENGTYMDACEQINNDLIPPPGATPMG